MEKPGCRERQHDPFAAEIVRFRLTAVRHAGRRVSSLVGK